MSTKLDIQVDVQGVVSQLKNHFNHGIKPDSKVFLHDKLKRNKLVDIMLDV